MVKQILTDAGFIENETFKETRFSRPPQTTYAVYLDSITRRGADKINLVTEHSVDIELYEYYPDRDSEAKIETELDRRGIEYSKESRFWIETEQIYQVIYTFNYISKGE